ncbi:hypothetical protein LA303_08015 [Candidatus Sulfidibacterium hydrothermale]|uniref:hypothetical protein n=1 Tax=Candidatus Sulfidibacterium hydrothermale TaxID=2875962 RepID=UPI001F0AFFA0|nr:hypothetical protein [Candidatus Sulfidibacterium hydrothermale]UBM61369.1 hypothetical protein LA303_08015 [Candidatus Sulfidibacterium hydrothermale]
MIQTEYIELNKENRNILINRLNETKKILDIKYKKYTVFLLTIIELGILFLIYLYEDYSFSIILKLLTVLPLWLIISITYLHFQKRLPAWRLNRFYTRILKANKYPVTRIISKHCKAITDSGIDYNIFDIGQNKIAVIRLQDFAIDFKDFPNNDFLVPQKNLFEIVGKRIITKGNKINCHKTYDKTFQKYINAMYMTDVGKILILKE